VGGDVERGNCGRRKGKEEEGVERGGGEYEEGGGEGRR
jgi:hypothetical protein